MKLEFNLRFKKRDFEDIIYKDNQADYLKSPIVKNHLRNLIFGLIGLVILFILPIVRQNPELIGFGVIVNFVLIYNYLRNLFNLRKWKIEVQQYLDKEAKHSTHKLILTEKTFSIIQDKNETIEKWSNFKSIKLMDDYLMLERVENILIPKK